MEYQKINTLFKRDIDNIIIPTEYTLPEFIYLQNCLFECTEKIDGTNIRIEIDWKSKDIFNIEFKGRTDRANIPEHLLRKLYQIFNNFTPDKIFEFKEPCHITIYGEGYGAKIQKGGNYISNDVNFILFDIKVGKWWLNRESLEDIAKKLQLNIVPIIKYMTIKEAIEFVKKGFKSTISENKDYDAEGLVLKTPYGLQLRNGERVILKIKTEDFRKYNNKYGNIDNPKQIPNSKYDV